MAENTEAEVYPKKQCSHGRCLNHSPKWLNIGDPYLEMVVLPLGWWGWMINFFRFFFLSWFCDTAPVYRVETTGFSQHCCGESTLSCRKVAERICDLCGRREKYTINTIQYCPCCGYESSWVVPEYSEIEPQTSKLIDSDPLHTFNPAIKTYGKPQPPENQEIGCKKYKKSLEKNKVAKE